MTEMKWEVIATFGGLLEAELAAGRLEDAGIPAFLDQGGNAGIFGAGHARPLGGVGLLVPSDQPEAAREALDLALDGSDAGSGA